MANPVVGIMHSGTPNHADPFVKRFKEALGLHLNVDYDEAPGNYGSNGGHGLDGIANSLMRKPRMKLVAALGGSASMLAAIAARRAGINVVFCCPDIELIPSPLPDFATGFCAGTSSLDNQRLSMLLEAVNAQPGDAIGVLLRGDRVNKASVLDRLNTVVREWNIHHDPRRPLTLDPQPVRPNGNDQVTLRSIEQIFQAWSGNVKGVLVTSDPVFHDLRANVVAIANRTVPDTMYQWDDFNEAGGRWSYGANLLAAYDGAGHYAGQILTGTSPTNLPPQYLAPYSTYSFQLYSAKKNSILPPQIRGQVHRVVFKKNT